MNTPQEAAEAYEDKPDRIRFGPARGNAIPADWVPDLLWKLHRAAPKLFGKHLTELYAEKTLGQDLTASQRKKPKG